MNKFSDFDIKPTLPNFIGEKKYTHQILNCEITIHDFRIEDSKFGDGNKKRLKLQISVSDIKYVMFSGSIYLAEQIQKVSKENFPFTTTITKEDKRLKFN